VSKWEEAPLNTMIPHNLEEHPLHFRVGNTPVNGTQVISLYSPGSGTTNEKKVIIHYVDSVPFSVVYWSAPYMRAFPTKCNTLDDGYRYLTIVKNVTERLFEVYCNGKRLVYNLNDRLAKDNIVWVIFSEDFETVSYLPHDRGLCYVKDETKIT
jgi:hypothetical protein